MTANRQTARETERVEQIDPEKGLTQAQVAERRKAGLDNQVNVRSSRSVGDILRANIFTLFNALLGGALICVLIVGSWPDAVFGFVLVINAVTGVIAELRAKRTLDKLAVIDAPTARVCRAGEVTEIPVAEVVRDDIVVLRAGDQIPADGEVLTSAGLEVDESILTGESEPVKKSPDDEVLSGASVVAGSGRARITKVGAEAYAQKITGEAKRFSLAHSELRAGIDTVLRIISWVIVPVTGLLIWAQVRAGGGWEQVAADGEWRSAVVQAVAGVVGMVPQGLVLLTSVNFALAAVLLARRDVLIQELPAVEVLARVDTLCLDKTGTLTSGELELEHIVYAADDADSASTGDNNSPQLPSCALSQQEIAGGIAALTAGDDANATASAISSGLADSAGGTAPQTPEVKAMMAFSSARKWSAISTAERAWFLGAPDILIDEQSHAEASAVVQKFSEDGARVLAVMTVDQPFDANTDPGEYRLPEERQVAALVILREELRANAADTLAWFARQDVAVKVISGDNPTTVAAIASRLGLDPGPEGGINARELPDFESDAEAFVDAINRGTVFGRVTPEQKREMVRALQKREHTVAMTGDGVNDALALKNADLGIAMGTGARATKASAKVVLLQSDYSALPAVVAEGRRVIANMERVATLFLNKTTYAAIIAVITALVGWSYPFLPRHLTLIGAFTIGIPAFFLALPPNNQRYRPGFLRRTLWRAVPAGIIGAIAVIVVRWWGSGDDAIVSTRATLVLAIISLTLLATLTRPILGWRGALLAAMIGGVVAAVVIKPIREFFALAALPLDTWWQLALVGGLGAIGVIITSRLANAREQREHAKDEVSRSQALAEITSDR